MTVSRNFPARSVAAVIDHGKKAAAASRRTPASAGARLDDDIDAAFADPATNDKLDDRSDVPTAGTPEQFRALHRMATGQWAKIVQSWRGQGRVTASVALLVAALALTGVAVQAQTVQRPGFPAPAAPAATVAPPSPDAAVAVPSPAPAPGVGLPGSAPGAAASAVPFGRPGLAPAPPGLAGASPPRAFPLPAQPQTVPPASRLPMPPPKPSPPVKGLPADAPPVVLGGGVYSPRPAHRLAIVNGQVVREGADLGSGLRLEQITSTGVVLQFRGARYRVSY